MLSQLAKEVLRLRLKEMNHQDALNEVAKKFYSSASVVGEAWAEYKQDAVISLRQERPQDTYASCLYSAHAPPPTGFTQ